MTIEEQGAAVVSTRWFWHSHRTHDLWWPLAGRGTDENCNRLVWVRVPGGALHLVLERRVRQKPCPECLEGEQQ